LLAHYAFYGDYLGVRTARKHIGWYVRSLPGGEPFRQAMNRLEDCDAQLAAVRRFFDAQQVYGERLQYGLAEDRLAA
jgi:tRNA-dihydrouridine synthase B